MQNKILTEPWNQDWIMSDFHVTYLTNNSIQSEGHEPKNLAEWAETALNKLYQIDLASDNLPILNLVTKTVPVNTLLPMQMRIKALKSLYDQLTNKWGSLKRCLTQPQLDTKNGPFPILTCIDKYVLDGHHRWAQYLISNPTTNVDILNVNDYRSALHIQHKQEFMANFNEVLQRYLIENKHMRVLTAEQFEEKEKQKNFGRMSLADTTEYIKLNITHESIELLTEYKKINKASKDEAVDYFLNNLSYFVVFVD